MTTDPVIVGNCLCLQAAYESAEPAMRTQGAVQDETKAEIARLTASLDQRRNSLPADQPEVLEQFRQDQAHLFQLQNRLNEEIWPAFRDRAASYNQAVEAYTRQCADRTYDAAQLELLRRSLPCRN
jgi:phosphoenolpyruvate-protein kinase (PTS system EI component)